MSRAKGTANLAASLEVLAGAPLDAREKVPTKADLYLAANFPYPYVGLETYVVSENKKYRLVGNDVTVEANWEEIGSGGGGGTTVVANPEGEATDELEKLQVGNDIYSIPQGGSGADTEIIADDFDAAESYAVGEYVVYEGTLYKCTTAHTGAWDASDFEDTQVMAEMPTPMPAADMSDIVTPLPGVMSRRRIYSPEEQVVGEWREYIDGVLKKKPVYEKTIQISMVDNSYVDVSALNINFINVSDVFFKWNYPNAGGGIVPYPKDSSIISIQTGNDSSGNVSKLSTENKNQYFTDSNCTTYVTVLYTKTTDNWEVV